MVQNLVIYFAGPLFTLAERSFNRELAEKISAAMDDDIEIILPQQDALMILKQSKSPIYLFDHLMESIKKADLIIAILDGADVDSGTSFEIGYAYGLKKQIIGVRTDFRKSEDRGVNLMLSRSMTKLFYKNSTDTSTHELAIIIADWITKKAKKKVGQKAHI